MTAPSSPLLEIKGISKSFGGVEALKDVSFEVLPATVHALVGENGAGKSTLVKILAGAYLPDSGMLAFEGATFDHLDPSLARSLGIAVIHQESSLVPWMTVVDNLFIGRELKGRLGHLDGRQMRRRAKDAFDRLGVTVELNADVVDLKVADRQLTEIARVLLEDSKLIVMDEPSAVIGGEELEQLFSVIRSLRAQGTSIIYISHRLVEIFSIATQVTVLKDGEAVGTKEVQETTHDEIVRMMVGRYVDMTHAPSREPDEAVALEVEGLRLWKGGPPIDFSVRAGEILGIGGMVGSGRTRVARALAGVSPVPDGAIRRGDRPVKIRSPRDAIQHGIVLIPEDRRALGLLLPRSVQENVGLASLREISGFALVNPHKEESLARTALDEFDIRPKEPRKRVELLSGGNQQKVVLAKWLVKKPDVIILDEPTRGVDVGAKAQIHRLIHDFAEGGTAVVMISSELPELIALSNRVMVMRDGAVAGWLERSELSEEAILRLAVSVEEKRA